MKIIKIGITIFLLFLFYFIISGNINIVNAAGGAYYCDGSQRIYVPAGADPKSYDPNLVPCSSMSPTPGSPSPTQLPLPIPPTSEPLSPTQNPLVPTISGSPSPTQLPLIVQPPDQLPSTGHVCDNNGANVGDESQCSTVSVFCPSGGNSVSNFSQCNISSCEFSISTNCTFDGGTDSNGNPIGPLVRCNNGAIVAQGEACSTSVVCPDGSQPPPGETLLGCPKDCVGGVACGASPNGGISTNCGPNAVNLYVPSGQACEPQVVSAPTQKSALPSSSTGGAGSSSTGNIPAGCTANGDGTISCPAGSSSSISGWNCDESSVGNTPAINFVPQIKCTPSQAPNASSNLTGTCR